MVSVTQSHVGYPLLKAARAMFLSESRERIPLSSRQSPHQGSPRQQVVKLQSKTSAECRKMTLGIFQSEGTPEGRGLQLNHLLARDAARSHKATNPQSHESKSKPTTTNEPNTRL